MPCMLLILLHCLTSFESQGSSVLVGVGYYSFDPASRQLCCVEYVAVS
jgi:hypothetical protein